MKNDMWRMMFFWMILCFGYPLLSAQPTEGIGHILAFTGYDREEQLDEYEVERLYAYLERPLKINSVSASVLRSCGLLSQYQSVSLIDYRTRHGDVMSMNELAMVDGFNRDVVDRLAPFISLEGGTAASAGKSGGYVSHDLAARGGAKVSEGAVTGQYALKYKCEIGNIGSLGFAMSRSSAGSTGFPDSFAGYACWSPENMPLRVLAGDFNARFGQGLALWNGFSMSGLSKTSSFYKSATGISPSSSFTGSSALTGVASEYVMSRFRISSLVIVPGIKDGDFTYLLPAVNVGWYGRNMSVSLTHYAELGLKSFHIPDMKTAADIALCLGGADLFSELAFDWVNLTPALLGGAIFPLKDMFRLAVHLRFYPASFNPAMSAAARSVSKCSNEYGASFCCDFTSDSRRHTGSISLDAAYQPLPEEDVLHAQLKVLTDWDLELSDCFKLKLKANERIRTWGRNFRTDVRLDMEWEPGKFILSSRVNVVRCAGTGLLAYLEEGYRTEKISLYLKQGYYNVSEWDDRIYSYERDAPGSFSVPAFYGRGLWTSLVACWKFARWGKAYLRTAIKPGNAELKLQCMFSF